MTSARPKLRHRYLLTVPIPYYEDPEGRVWLGQLWAIDLAAHLDYLTELTVLAPRERITSPGPDMVEVQAPDGVELNFVPLGLNTRSSLAALLSLPKCTVMTWRAVGAADLVHSGVAGWPVPPGLVVNPVAMLRRKPLIIVIESAFWRLQDGGAHKWPARLRATLTESFARWTLRHTDFAVYSHKGYQESLPIGPKGTDMVLPASWVSEADILSEVEAEARWQAKPSTPQFLFASRLVEQKGAPLLLEALRRLEAEQQPIVVDVIGSGPLRAEFESLAASSNHVRIRVLDPVPYGRPFLELLQRYHGVVVPTTGDEQPRILYDAFSQAVAVVATSTAGNREVVEHGKTGHIVAEGSAPDLADALESLSRSPADLKRMGLAALATARDYSHAVMHDRRAEALMRMFGSDPD